MIEITDLTNFYNGKPMLQQINLSIKQGEFLVLFGAKGAGKTTLLHVTMGFLTKYKGSVEIFGKNANQWNAEERSQVRFVPDDILWEQNMTGAEYLRFVRSRAIAYDEKLEKELSKEFEVPLEDKLLDLSYQENKFIQIIAAVCARPKFLILDEPLHYLGIQGYQALLKCLQQLQHLGTGIFLAVEKYTQARGFGTHYAYLKQGELLQVGKTAEVKRRHKVVTVVGKAPERFQNAMEKCISEQTFRSSYLYCGDMVRLPGVLELLGEQDFTVEEMTLEEELDQNYARWE